MQYDEIIAAIKIGLKRLDKLGLEILAIKTGFNQCSEIIKFRAQTDEVKTNLLESDMKQINIPCLVGDTVYHIGRQDKKVHTSLVKQILITRSGVRVRLRCGKKGIVGKDIFLTKQEAEKEMKTCLAKKD